MSFALRFGHLLFHLLHISGRPNTSRDYFIVFLGCPIRGILYRGRLEALERISAWRTIKSLDLRSSITILPDSSIELEK